MTGDSEFEIANRAFEMFTLAERLVALDRFSKLRYRSIADRFFEAVHSVIVDMNGERQKSQRF
jgi:hypothetical protein